MLPNSETAQSLLTPAQAALALDSCRELIAILGSDGTILNSTPNFEDTLAYRADDPGQGIYSLVHSFESDRLHQTLAELLRWPKGRYNTRCRLLCRDGSWRWFDLSLTNHLETPGVEGFLLHGLDVTNQQRMEAERQVIADIVHALNTTSNLDQLLRHIHGALKRVIAADNCFVALHAPSSDTFEFPFFADEFDSAPAPQKVGRSCTAFVFRSGQARLIPQFEFDRLVEAGEVELVGSPSPAWLGVPLKTPNATIGVLVVQHYRNAMAYDQRDLEFMDSVGGHIALAIERRRAEEELRRNESMLRLLFEHNPVPTWLYDNDTLRFLRVNAAAVKLYGFSQEEFENIDILAIRPPSEREKAREFVKTMRGEPEQSGIWLHQTRDGRVFEAEIISHQLTYAGRSVRLVVAQDVSERKNLESQLRQAQKMEAVGRLAGGVAHDFNNLLMVIKGHTELLLNVLPPSDHVARKIQQIDRSADRAAALTRQLLAFSRMQVLQPQAIKLNSIVEELGKLLPRLIGEDIELVIRSVPELGTIRADASQMEQVIMNLVVNARDAMPNGGKLLIETSNVDLDRNYTSTHTLMEPGPYVQLSVSDNGIGMNAETQAHIFEPFFTTKEKGKGTGLGLATVYGIIKQSGGFIWVYSEVDKGTTFKIYLPRVDQAEDHLGVAKPVQDIPTGHETVLLTEDETDVRQIARQFLESGGYNVIEAKDGADALRLAAENEGKIDVLVTDIVMPGMSGQELATRVQKQDPNLCVVFMSGYSEHAATEMAHADPTVRLLTKPFSRAVILRAIREVLNQKHSE